MSAIALSDHMVVLAKSTRPLANDRLRLQLGSRRARCEAESKLQPKAPLAILRRKGMNQASARHAMIFNPAHFEEGLEMSFPGLWLHSFCQAPSEKLDSLHLQGRLRAAPQQWFDN